MNKHEGLVELIEMMRTHSRLWTMEWSKNNPLEISLSQAMALEILHAEGPKPSTYLSQAVGVTSGGMTVISDKLVRQELVRRINDSGDRRVVKLELTENGKNVIARIKEKREALMDKLFAPLNATEVSQMIAIYRKLLEQLPREDAR